MFKTPTLAENWKACHENLFSSRSFVNFRASIDIVPADSKILDLADVSLFDISQISKREKRKISENLKNLNRENIAKFEFEVPKKPAKRKAGTKILEPDDEIIAESKVTSEFTKDLTNPDEIAQGTSFDFQSIF